MRYNHSIVTLARVTIEMLY